MKIAVTADLHYEHSDQSRAAAAALAAEICQTDADALVIAGDTFAYDMASLEACLHLFDGFDGAKCLVAGNHDLWVGKGEDSLAVYEQALPERAAACGFHYLDHRPLQLDGVAIVGNVGWYDYAFGDPQLGMPQRFYERKLGPQLAGALRSARHLVDGADDIPPAARDLACMWNDGRFVRWHYRDEEFVDLLADRLRSHLDEVNATARSIVCVTHHLPFENMVRRHADPRLAFSNAYMGSPRLGEIMLRYPKVRYAVCGHSHVPGQFDNGALHCINVGSTYTAKRYEMLEV